MEFRPIFSSLLRNKTGALLIAMQIALTLAIVSNALHIVTDRLSLAARPSGIDDESRVFHISITPFKNQTDKVAMQQRDEQVIRSVPGVTSAAWTTQTPMSRSGWSMGFATDRKQTDTINAAFYMTPGPLLATFGLKLLQGRDFNDADIMEVDPSTHSELGRVAIISKPLADKLYPGAASVIGKPILIGTGDSANELRIIGVVERLQTPWAQTSEKNEYSVIAGVRFAVSYSQYAVRTEPGQLDRVMREVEAALTKSESGRLIVSNDSVQTDRNNRYRDDKAVAWLLTTVTIMLLLVTASGIVGMATLWVNQRRKQIGVRRALGARRVDVLRYFITENVLITTGGIAVGLMLAMALNQLLVSQLEMARLPLGYLAVGSGLLWLLGVLAVYGPAWRASGISPAIATRSA